MSLGGPRQSRNVISPPERGSFPLDHEGDCKAIVKEYLACVKRSRGSNDQCRHLARQFLECRMEHGLMARDEFANLGFVDADPKS